MNRFLALLLAGIVAASAAFAFTWKHLASRTPDEMTWLQQEFRLSPEQFSAIDKLRQDYDPVCADHCARIAKARKHLLALKADPNASPADLQAADAAWQALCAECTAATRQHLEAVAAQMTPEEGRRYLAVVGPKLTQREPGKPFGLR